MKDRTVHLSLTVSVPGSDDLTDNDVARAVQAWIDAGITAGLTAGLGIAEGTDWIISDVRASAGVT